MNGNLEIRGCKDERAAVGDRRGLAGSESICSPCSPCSPFSREQAKRLWTEGLGHGRY